ncbi:hypothetical protein MAP00_006981 [Monascus purpureus]|nr:hypothetical protein MAP00_006981 [Monascus purpureus]
MSTQPHPPPPTPKGVRNNRRHSKRNMTPHAPKQLLSTPPSSPPRDTSPADASYYCSNGVNMSKKKNVRSGKKPRDVSNNGHRHTSSQPNLDSPSHMKNSPHYAGPTFHASPAPSALPIPSFFSKSVPESDSAPVLDMDSDVLEAGPDLENTPSKPKPRIPCVDGQKPTPLDFLFKAALEARNGKIQYDSETETRNQSPAPISFSTPLSHRKPESPAGGIFQLDMENPDICSPPTNYSIANSYKHRMDSLRSTSLPSRPVENLDENERKAKTEALKDLLLNPRPQRPSSSVSPLGRHKVDALNGDVRPVSDSTVPHFVTPLRATSGPATSNSYQRSHAQKNLISGNCAHSPFFPSQTRSSEQFRNQDYTLKQQASPSGHKSMAGISGGTFTSPHVAYCQPNPINTPALQQIYGSPVSQQSKLPQGIPVNPPSSNKSLDTKKMEDDLRRILKLNAAPGIHSSSIQSSYA